VVSFSHASGIIINTACGRLRPARCNNSSTSSKLAESDASGVQVGNSRRMLPGSNGEASNASRAAIQFRLPRIVLISPLCAMNRYGWASGHDGNVFVEKRECTNAIAEATRASDRSGKYVRNWSGVSIPL
jgi:hypothetical protein